MLRELGILGEDCVCSLPRHFKYERENIGWESITEEVGQQQLEQHNLPIPAGGKATEAAVILPVFLFSNERVSAY